MKGNGEGASRDSEKQVDRPTDTDGVSPLQAVQRQVAARRVCLCRVCVLTVEVAVSLSEGGLQVGAEPGDRSFDLCVALLAQLLLHFHRAARETLWTYFERGSCKTRDIDAVQYRETNDKDQKELCSKIHLEKKLEYILGNHHDLFNHSKVDSMKRQTGVF